MRVFRRFKRKSTDSTGGYVRPEDRLSPVPGAYRHMEAPTPHDPTPEYIEEAGTPTEGVWEREEALYRKKDDEEPRA